MANWYPLHMLPNPQDPPEPYGYRQQVLPFLLWFENLDFEDQQYLQQIRIQLQTFIDNILRTYFARPIIYRDPVVLHKLTRLIDFLNTLLRTD